MKYIFLIEMPTRVLSGQRLVIRKQLSQISLEVPKRNVFVIETKNSEAVEKIKDRVISFTDEETKVSYYRLHDDQPMMSKQSKQSKQSNFL